MINKFLFLSFVFCLNCCKQEPKLPVISFNKTELNFQIKRGSSKKAVFFFKNTGSNNLILTDVSTDCGCTQLIYNKHAILPLNKDSISVIYNNSLDGNKLGKAIRYVLVKSNTTPILHTLKINIFVKDI